MKKKKIFYLFSVNQKFFTDTSIELNKIKNLDINVSGIAYSKYSYFKNFDYQNLYYVNEITDPKPKKKYLKYLKVIKYEKYLKIVKATLSELIHLDRHISRLKKKDKENFALKLFYFITNYIEKEKPDLIISEGVDDLVSFVACNICLSKKIKFFSLQHARFGSGLIISDLANTGSNKIISDYKYYYNKINSENIKITSYDKTIKGYVKNKKKVFYLNKKLDFKFLRISDIKKFLYYIFEYIYDPKGFHYKDNPIFLPINRSIRIFKFIYYKFFLDKIKLSDLNKIKYFYFGLHVFPEASTLILGRHLPDQINLIKLISKAIPLNNYLIIKEHPHSLGKRDLFFYREIDKLHNVKFIDEKVNNYEILKGSLGLVTISSSLTIESILLNKKTVILGDYYLSIDKNTFTPKTFKDLVGILKAISSHKFDFISRKSILYAIIKNSIFLDGYINSRIYTNKSIKQFCKYIENYYLLK